MRKLDFIVHASMLVGLSGTYAAAQKKCMFVGASPTGDRVIKENHAYDEHIIPLLKEWGYEIDQKHICENVLEYTAADFEPYDFVFLSETIHTSRIGESLRKIHKPMLSAEAMGTRHTKLGFATGGDESAGVYHPGKSSQILASVGDHPLAAGYAPGTDINFGDFSSKNSCLMTWGTPTIDVIPIAGTKGNLDQLVAFGIERGTINTHGETINNRVAVVGTHAWCYRAEYIGEPMKNLLKAGIQWILEGATSVNGDESAQADGFRLSLGKSNSSNAFSFSIPREYDVTLTLWSLSGKKLMTVSKGIRSAGKHSVGLPVTRIPNGMYLVNLDYGTGRLSKVFPLTRM